MNRVCMICGRILSKSMGVIGPRCSRKIQNFRRRFRISNKAYIKYAEKHDIFREEDVSGSGENEKTSTGST